MKKVEGWRTEGGTWILLKPLAREMRSRPTPAENLLWQALRFRGLGVKFKRHQPLGPFIVDFFCTERKLVVEVDGGIHLAQPEADASRQEFLESQGLAVVRFSNEQVEAELEGVLRTITEALRSRV